MEVSESAITESGQYVVDMSEDMEIAVKALEPCDLFGDIPGRRHPGFEDYKHTPHEVHHTKMMRKLKERKEKFAEQRRVLQDATK